MIVSFPSPLSEDKYPFILLSRQLCTTPYTRLVTRLLFSHKCGHSYAASLTTKFQPAFVANHEIVMQKQSLAVQFLDIQLTNAIVGQPLFGKKKKNHHHAFYHPKNQNRLNMKLKKQRQQYVSNPKLNFTMQQKLENKQIQITVLIILHWSFKNQECSQNIKQPQLMCTFWNSLHKSGTSQVLLYFSMFIKH